MKTNRVFLLAGSDPGRMTSVVAWLGADSACNSSWRGEIAESGETAPETLNVLLLILFREVQDCAMDGYGVPQAGGRKLACEETGRIQDTPRLRPCGWFIGRCGQQPRVNSPVVGPFHVAVEEALAPCLTEPATFRGNRHQ